MKAHTPEGELLVAKSASLWKFGGLTPLTLIKNTVKEIGDDDVAGHAAELSYYFMLALFPALLFLMTIFGFLAGPGSQLRDDLLRYMAKAMPPSASALLQNTIREISQNSTALKALLSSLGALWAATGGIDAIAKTLNIAYDVTETRPFIKRKLTSIGLTIGLAVLIIGALAVLLFGGKIGGFLAAKIGLGSAFALTWNIIQWPLALFAMFLCFSLIYYFAPNLKAPEWSWISPGAAVGVVVWMVASALFSLYLQYFNSYSKTYGSVGAVIILMLWLYLTGLAVLIGGEFNSEIMHAEKLRTQHERTLERTEAELAA